MLQEYYFHGNIIRAVELDNELWFVLVDLNKVLHSFYKTLISPRDIKPYKISSGEIEITNKASILKALEDFCIYPYDFRDWLDCVSSMSESTQVANAVKEFYYKCWRIRTVQLEGKTWFILADIRRAMGWNTNVTKFIPPKSLSSYSINGKKNKLKIVDEVGVKKLLNHFHPVSLDFASWITTEVGVEIVVNATSADGETMEDKEDVPEISEAGQISNESVDSSNLQLFKFEDNTIDIIEINGKPHFEIYSTGMALGYIKSNSNGGSYPRKERIEQTAKNADIVPSVHGGHRYFSEEQLYDFMLEARTVKCKPFRKWVVSEVLPSIRKTGTYTTDKSVADNYDVLIQMVYSLTYDVKRGKMAKITIDKIKNILDIPIPISHKQINEQFYTVREYADAFKCHWSSEDRKEIGGILTSYCMNNSICILEKPHHYYNKIKAYPESAFQIVLELKEEKPTTSNKDDANLFSDIDLLFDTDPMHLS